jgi:hypothetical protein
VLGTNRSLTDVKRSGSCVAHGCSVAGRTPKDDWTACSYEAHWIVPASASDPLDTVAENEVVLYRSQPKRRGARLTPVWHEVYEPEIQRSVMPSVTRVQPGTDLLAIQECLNGTGGCGESFLIDRGTGWRPVRLTFLDSVERRYPSGHSDLLGYGSQLLPVALGGDPAAAQGRHSRDEINSRQTSVSWQA